MSCQCHVNVMSMSCQFNNYTLINSEMTPSNSFLFLIWFNTIFEMFSILWFLSSVHAWLVFSEELINFEQILQTVNFLPTHKEQAELQFSLSSFPVSWTSIYLSLDFRSPSMPRDFCELRRSLEFIFGGGLPSRLCESFFSWICFLIFCLSITGRVHSLIKLFNEACIRSHYQMASVRKGVNSLKC